MAKRNRRYSKAVSIAITLCMQAIAIMVFGAMLGYLIGSLIGL